MGGGWGTDDAGDAPQKSHFTVNVYHGKGVSNVYGGGEYARGADVTLTATVKTGFVFEGWYSYESADRYFDETEDLTIYSIDCDLDVYAICVGEAVLKPPVEVYDARWVVEDRYSGKYITTVYGSPTVWDMPSIGAYNFKLTATTADGKAYSYEDAWYRQGAVRVTYDFTFENRPWYLWWEADYLDYAYYKELETVRHHTNKAGDAAFVTATDSLIQEITDAILDGTRDMSKLRRANFILAFVQSLEYEYDSDGTDYDEYWKYPVETLYEKRGDCEDTAILYAALMKAAGYDVALINLPGHEATGIAMPETTIGTYYLKDGKRYYYCETTGTGWKLGDYPPEYRGISATVYSI
ncbi:MAG: hypothetical protein LBG62_01875 [Candidatus Methanoplasma sp.]|nr:hypothetical protein [Candidatus Methanoplasma sp.]